MGHFELSVEVDEELSGDRAEGDPLMEASEDRLPRSTPTSRAVDALVHGGVGVGGKLPA